MTTETESTTPTTETSTQPDANAGSMAMNSGENGHGPDEQLQLVTFELANEEFAVDILSVQEINRMMELTRVPQSPPDVEGVINLRGRIIPVIELRRRFKMPPGERSAQNRIVVVEVHGQVIGFIVDRVHEVLRIPARIVDKAPEMACSIDSEFIRGVGKLDDRLLILLDLSRMFDAEMAAELAA